ncbi:MAG: 2-C-methyl-D-erythritol 4-phosphate cytidylyltransferase [Candidatus Cloacimonetes bacterium]|nr:2-C-methyl-D-erythritol 4-phosphate cytidylyltransferase [Candidatus Cloacimonadota bacterium]HNZ06617.1 2-C-methyl-D-erythritol 4-phosphate cytidylyltransferase [Candidatus Cloacimonadota bacterium]HOH78676.1 2-C-methyl-D-erythritol 4-phosphate cytidylyltransferase [Candidatus Cloacimonadota bacterium]
METMNTAIVTAAGSGLRLNSAVKKQFLELAGIPILIRTLERFFASPLISSLIITAPEADQAYTEELIRQYFEAETKPWIVIAGGAERQDSVFAALQHCPPGTKLVFIHDAVRPFITLDLIADLASLALKHKAAIPVARIKHTIKTIEGEVVGETLPRDRLVQVFTPQVFDLKLIRAAYEKAYEDGFVSTDDSSLVEHLGHAVPYLFSSDLNLKITDASDLFFASQIIENNMV